MYRSIIILLLAQLCGSWGFFGHQWITRQAIFSLPPELQQFYYKHLKHLIRQSTIPDQRRYIVVEEGSRHYIDLDLYDTASLPKSFQQAKDQYGEILLKKNGTGPWHTEKMYQLLVQAFTEKNKTRIIRLSAELSHYIADLHVPLHTHSNHNGQYTNQHGIHGLWETDIVNWLWDQQWRPLVPRAVVIEEFSIFIWTVAFTSHSLVKTVLEAEQQVRKSIGVNRIAAIEKRRGKLQNTYSGFFLQQYHLTMNNMVSKRFEKSIHSVASAWYSAWTAAGEPALTPIPSGKSFSIKGIYRIKNRRNSH